MNVFRNLGAVSLGDEAFIGNWNQITAAPAYQKYHREAGRLFLADGAGVVNRHYLDCSGSVRIGRMSMIGGIRSIIQSHELDLYDNATSIGTIDIGEYVFTGTAVLVLKGARIPDRTVVAAGATWTELDDDASPGLYAGTPARRLKAIDDAAWMTREHVHTPVTGKDDSFMTEHERPVQQPADAAAKPTRRRRRFLGVRTIGCCVAVALLFGLGVAAASATQWRTDDALRVQTWDFTPVHQGLAGLTVIDRNRNLSGVAIGDSGLGHGAARAPDAAVYLQREFASPVGRIGASVDFGRSGSGSVALVLPARGLPSAPARFDSDFPNAGVHLVVNARTWEMSVWERSFGQRTLASGSFDPVLVGILSIDVTRRRDTVHIALPDGRMESVSDSRIGSYSGRYAVWELFENNAGDVGATLTRIWAAD
ncbi:acyltransferase [Gordonia hankookensis]|uniref:Acetyltransferase n=1 Tax=Gordonia hankookensis TaxID=589403 RepID=A0ABR7W886_9ACTN|nr:hypothetical protein [Gordonia hankookensis]MBD1319027.1 hypothetical protein [Gordonia hankookensis]